MKITVLAENKVYEENLIAEHGLSLYVESGDKRILFDSGQSSKTIDNAKYLDIPLDAVDLAILSHGHFDHSGGFHEFRKTSAAPIYIHKDAICSSYAYEKDGSLENFDCGINWICSGEHISAGVGLHNQKSDNAAPIAPSNIVFTDGPVWIDDNIVISGSIPKKYRRPHTEKFARISAIDKDMNTAFAEDPMEHEQFLGIREGDRVYLITGCSHNGPESVIEYGKELFGCDEIEALIGGMHMGSLSQEASAPVAKEISTMGVKKVIPLHCTGLNAIFEFKRLYLANCILLNVGDCIDL